MIKDKGIIILALVTIAALITWVIYDISKTETTYKSNTNLEIILKPLDPNINYYE